MEKQQEKISNLREIINTLHNSSDEPDWEAVYDQILSALSKGDEKGLLKYDDIYFRGYGEHLADYAKQHIFEDITKAQLLFTKQETGRYLSSHYVLTEPCPEGGNRVVLHFTPEQWQALKSI